MNKKLLTRYLAAALFIAAAIMTPMPADANPLGIPDTEYDALVAFYNSTNGENWFFKTNWLTSNPDWYGVTVSSGHVTAIDLGFNGLTGSLPPEIGDLSGLQELYLLSNQLTGTIPSEIGNLSELDYLNLGNNPLTGVIPQEIGNLTKLQYLRTSNTQLSGSIPSEIGNLTVLEYAYMGSARLTGSIPSEIGNLTSLVWLDIGYNQLEGPIPSEIGNLTELQFLSVGGNRLTGAVPSEFSSLDNLSNGFGLQIQYNGLFSSDPELSTFLESKSSIYGDWEATQTVAPEDFAIDSIADDSVTFSWTPIQYTSHSGYYEVGISGSSGGPYTFAAENRTADKSASSILVDGLGPGTTYFVIRTVTLPHPANQNTVTSLISTELSVTIGTPEEVTIGAAKLLGDGVLVSIQNVVVTSGIGQIDGVCYIEQPDRSAGIAVATETTLAEGDVVNVTGKLDTLENGERAITDASVQVVGSTSPINPVFATLRALASASWHYDAVSGAGQRGVDEPQGVSTNTVGLLFEVSGRVTGLDDDYLFINDGSFPTLTGVRVERTHTPAEVQINDFVRVRGISSMRKQDTVHQLLIKPRMTEDISIGP